MAQSPKKLEAVLIPSNHFWAIDQPISSFSVASQEIAAIWIHPRQRSA